MIFSNSTEYAIRGLAELACRPTDCYVLLDDLVNGTDLPRDFLAKIFQTLVRAKILRSVKGRNGGFALARPAREVTLKDILQAIDGPQPLDRCVIGLTACNDHMPCAQHDLYKPIRQRLASYLATTTLADLGASLRTKKSWQKIHDSRGTLQLNKVRSGNGAAS